MPPLRPLASLPASRRPTTSPGQAPSVKIAIPRLKIKPGCEPVSFGSATRQRVTQACGPCRQRKSKCPGDKPVCRQCLELNISCYYTYGKREMAEKNLKHLSNKIQDYEGLLHDLSLRADDQDAQLIRMTLQKHSEREDTLESLETSSLTEADLTEDSPRASSVESAAFMDDHAEEDFNRSERAQATGFMGQSSEISWMQRLQREADQGSTQQHDDHFNGPDGLHAVPESDINDVYKDTSTTSASYHLDDLGVSISEAVEPYAIPPRETADKLFNAYLVSVHPSFPIIGKAVFTSQYNLFYDQPSAMPGHKWLAILNMIFAIAAKYSLLIQAGGGVDDRDHLIYFTRAKALSMNGDAFFSHPDLQRVQVEGLVAFYFLATGQINRSWKFSGISVRSAFALGLNLRSGTADTSDISKEIRYRVWWSLYTLEHLLSTMTGRPASIDDGVCTAPFPIPFEEENFHDENVSQLLNLHSFRDRRVRSTISRLSNISTRTSTSLPASSTSGPAANHDQAQEQVETDWLRTITPNASLYFLYFVDLTSIMQEVIRSLYTARAIHTAWVDTEHLIARLSSKTEAWRSRLPEAYDVTIRKGSATFQRQRLNLAFLYYSTKITLTRPCLCRLDRQAAHTRKLKKFTHDTAALCVSSACHMLDLIPDEPDAIGLSNMAPWWCVLHYLMQSTTVLLLELTFRARHMPDDAKTISNAMKKAIRWLHHMSQENSASHRAWMLCDGFVRRLATDIGLDVSDLPMHPRQQNPTVIQTPTMTTTSYPEPNATPWEVPHQNHLEPLASSFFVPVPYGEVMHPAICTDYDEYLLYTTATEETTNYFTPTFPDMDQT
ncbi:fungal specific transcription factor domain-containing protein [Blastomyces dermatitidis ATCC 18188]|uniref:Fungal specific transcription factor domain-containing protein n=2 Tax=Ajellomyces dermatitidis (strain ATCC 18188 / CBS 674.68) TaxID=653446 RepID=F2TPC3_AJEDA|nr:fungal specific transcription factor domain-containing protein [Blastomyces dermatitidis ATCC 18188]